VASQDRPTPLPASSDGRTIDWAAFLEMAQPTLVMNPPEPFSVLTPSVFPILRFNAALRRYSQPRAPRHQVIPGTMSIARQCYSGPDPQSRGPPLFAPVPSKTRSCAFGPSATGTRPESFLGSQSLDCFRRSIPNGFSTTFAPGITSNGAPHRHHPIPGPGKRPGSCEPPANAFE